MKKKVIIMVTSFLCVVGITLGLVLGLVLGKPKDDKDPTPPTAIYHDNFTIEKNIEGQSKTISLGDRIVYNISITNESETGLKVTVTDIIPTNTTYVTGGDKKEDSTISWDVVIDGNDSCVVSYTVEVDNNSNVVNGSQITSTVAQAGQKQATCNAIYVASTLNEADRSCMASGIRTLSYTENLDNLAILRQMYQHAFTLSPDLKEEPKVILDKVFETTKTTEGNNYRAMTIPTLYGGVDVSSALDDNFVGDREVLKKSDLIEGDVLFVEHSNTVKVFVFDGTNLLLLDGGCKEVDTDAIISGVATANRFVAMRPSMTLTQAHYTGGMTISEDMSLEQKVLLATVQSYINRGFRLQYDDTHMNYPYKTSTDKGEYRWQIGQYNPEDYTTQKWGYINCAAFTYDVYKTALGMDLGDLYTTAKLTEYYSKGGNAGVDMYPYCYAPNTTASDIEKDNVKTQFMDTLEIGDLIIVRRTNSTGHVLMYVGNNMAVNSNGSNCAYDDSETFEASIRYINIDAYLFEPTATNYIFRADGTIKTLSIVRPLDIYDGVIPQNSLNRLNNLDIFAEKLSSHAEGQSVNSGDEVTFTLRITNIGKESKTLNITDIVPTNTIFKSASHNAIVEGNNIAWNVEIEAGETIEVIYVVTASGEDGDYIYGTDTKIGGVVYTCPKIYIRNTLTAVQQEAIREVALKFLTSNPSSLARFELISEIYKQAGLEDPFASVTETQLRESLIKATTSGLAYGKNLFELNTDSSYYGLVVDTLYGGRNFFTPMEYTTSNKTNTNRARLPRKHSLIVGDILITKFTSSENCYLYIGGDKFLVLNSADVTEDTYDVGTRLTRMISARHYYCVLRPSYALAQN